MEAKMVVGSVGESHRAARPWRAGIWGFMPVGREGGMGGSGGAGERRGWVRHGWRRCGHRCGRREGVEALVAGHPRHEGRAVEGRRVVWGRCACVCA